MNISALEAFVESQNCQRTLFKQRPLSLTSAADRREIALDIDCRLSPENLHCDGEISRREARMKYDYLTRCAQELLSIDPTIKFWEYSE